MAFIRDGSIDLMLADVQNGTRLDICTAEPTTFTEATSTFSCGNETGLIVSGPEDGASGRKITIPVIADGSVTADATCSHWALTDGTTLYATGSLVAAKAVANGDGFTLDAIEITGLDAVSA